MNIFRLVAEDFTGLGGPMGTERTHQIFTKNFSDVEAAKRHAQNDYKKRGGKQDIKWQKNRQYLFSGDLLWIGYYIYIEKVN